MRLLNLLPELMLTSLSDSNKLLPSVIAAKMSRVMLKQTLLVVIRWDA